MIGLSEAACTCDTATTPLVHNKAGSTFLGAVYKCRPIGADL